MEPQTHRARGTEKWIGKKQEERGKLKLRFLRYGRNDKGARMQRARTRRKY